MALSYAQQTQLTCPECGTSFDASVWLILDATEQPGQVDINAGTYHSFACPHCQQGSIQIDAPLLLYEHSAIPPLQFLPAHTTTPDEDYQQATELVRLFRELLADSTIPSEQHSSHNDSEAPAELQKALRTAHETIQNYHITGERTTLETTIAQWQQILKHPHFLLSPEQFQIIVLNDSGSAFLQHYWATGQVEDLDTVVRLWKYAIYRLPFDSPYLPILFMNLAVCLNTRFERLGYFPDLQQAIDACRAAAAGTSEDSPILHVILSNLGLGLRDSYNHTGKTADLDEAIRIFHKALELAPANTIDQANCRTNLGLGLLDRYNLQGRPADLEQAITLCDAAVTQTSPNIPERSAFLNNLGKGLRARYEWKGELLDIEGAIGAFQNAVDTTPGDAPDLPTHLSNLGLSLRDRYNRLGQLADLDRAIQTFQRAIPLIEHTAHAFPIIASNLGLVLHARYRRQGKPIDLEQSISAFEQAVRLAAEDSPYYPSFLGNLGMSLGDRYDLTGLPEDLEQRIWAHQKAIASSAPDAPERASHLSSWGSALFDRYIQTGRIEDLQDAIVAFQQAAQYAPLRTPDRALYLSNVGLGLRTRYTHEHTPDDLEQAITAFQQAIEQNTDNEPDHARYLSGLGGCFHDLYVRNHQLADLEQSINAFQRALALTAPGSPDLKNYRNNLGTALRSRYLNTKRQDDLQESLRLLREIVQETSSDLPALPNYLNNLGLSLEDLYSFTGQPSDLQNAVAAYEQACQKGLLLCPDVAFTSARSWGNWASKRKNWSEAVRAYDYGVQAIEQLYAIQLSRGSQETWLSAAYGLHARAAYALARLNRLNEAATMLEQGRARRLREILGQDRAELACVQNEAPEIYHHYLQAVARLNQLEQAEKEGLQLSKQEQLSNTITRRPPRQEQPTTAHHEKLQQAQAELQAAIAQIQHLPGHDRFLALPPQQLVPELGIALVYLVTTAIGSFTLLLFSANETHSVIWTDNLNEAALNSLLIQRHSLTNETIGGYLPGQLFHPTWLQKALEQISSQLGPAFIAPLADALRGQALKGVVLIPVGLLGLLPLHAIHYQKERHTVCLLDEFAVAYAPSAQVYSAVSHEAERRQQQDRDTPLHFVGVGNPLPDMQVVQEAQAELRQLLPMLQGLLSSQLPQLQAYSLSLPFVERAQFLSLLKLWQETLERLAHASRNEATELLDSGLDLLRTATMFSLLQQNFPQLALDRNSNDLLQRLAKSIPPSLPYARSELESIHSLLPAGTIRLFYEQYASYDAVWQALHEAQIGHFACHGSFETERPLDSALQLAKGSRLTLSELLSPDAGQFVHLRLVILSACQTAIGDFQRTPDEVLGLMSGFLQAGVPAVVGTLWSINDRSSALLLTRFYQYYLHDELYRGQPAQALRQAQCWLRDLTNDEIYRYLSQQASREQVQLAPSIVVNLLPIIRKARRENKGTERPYADPYHWGAFVYYGTLNNSDSMQPEGH